MLMRFIAAFLLVFFPVLIQASDLDDARGAYKRKEYALAHRLLAPLAEQGDPQAQFGLGIMFFNGQGVSKDQTTAFHLFNVSAESGSPDAQAFLALASFGGLAGLPRDFKTAVSWAKKSADQGNPLGRSLLAIAYLNGNGVSPDTNLAIQLLTQARSQGSPLAEYEMGKMMLAGYGMARDETRARILLRDAAAEQEAIKPRAERLLNQATSLFEWRTGLFRLPCESMSCAMRFGTNRKDLKAEYEDHQWIELAARTLDVGAKNDLLYYYLGRASEGIGDLSQAVIYYELSINPRERGLPCAGVFNNCDGINLPRDAVERLDALKRMQAEQNQIDKEREEKAFEAKRLAEEVEAARTAKVREEEERGAFAAAHLQLTQKALSGDADAQYDMARFYFSGESVDEKTGISWLVKSAQGGNPAAQYELGTRFLSGAGVVKDETKAETWVRRAVDQGLPDKGDVLAQIAFSRRVRAAAAAEIARKQESEREQLERKKKLENAAKLKSL